MTPRYPVVLFDVGQTLLGPRQTFGTVYARVLADLGLPLAAPALDRAIREASLALASAIPPGADRFSHFGGGEAGYWLRFIESVLALTVESPVHESFVRRALGPLRDAFLDASVWRVYDDVVPVLERLRREGFRLGIVSNWDSRLPAVLEATGLATQFDAVCVSQIEGFEKPDPRLFHQVLERLRARPEQALHIGDAPELDLAGARAAGVEALLVDRSGCFAELPGTLRDLAPVPEIARVGLGF